MKLRKHQEDARTEAHKVALLNRKITVAHVTPGGGKTIMASVFAHTLIQERTIERVVVLCPRDSLRSQMGDGFHVHELGLDRQLVVWDPKQSNRQVRMDKVVGVSTTYQAAVAHEGRLLRLVQSAPTLLVLDEGHHLAGQDEDDDETEDQLAWRRVVTPLVEAAKRVLVMTGTIYRSDEQRIPFVEYDASDKPIAHIRYTRQDALDEGAVLPIEFRMWDGDARFSYRGEEKEAVLSEATGDEGKRALRTALADLRGVRDDEPPGYVLKFLRNALDEWLEYRRHVYQSRAIVVCVSQNLAKWVAARVEEMGHDVVLAISDEEDSGNRIRKFRKGVRGEVLVTVGMAYEGLDVPDCTHMLLLTNRRARPWLEQAIARVTRINRACDVSADEQVAYVYVSDDQRARVFVDQILAEQDQSVPLKERLERAGIKFRGRATLVPHECTATVRNEGSDRFGRLTDEQSREVEELRAICPELAHIPAIEMLRRSVKLSRKYGLNAR